LHNWNAWSPWAKLDPNAKQTFAGPQAGEGASFSWAGNSQVGEGRMTIIESKPNELVRYRLEFIKPFAATNQATFRFDGGADGTTVTWAMDGDNGFLAKAFSLVADLDSLVGKDFEKGLANMREAAMKNGPAAAQP